MAGNDAAVEARNKGMMALSNHHAQYSRSMIASRYRGTDSKPAIARKCLEVPTETTKEEQEKEKKKDCVLSLIKRWQYVNMDQLKTQAKTAYLSICNSDFDNLVSELLSEGRVFKQGNQYYVKK